MYFEQPTSARTGPSTAETPPHLYLTLIGGFTLLMITSGTEIVVPHSAQRLLAFLALSPRPLQRAYVAGNLWPDTTEERSAASLRSTLWRLRRPGVSLIRSTATHLGLATGVAVDTREVEVTVHRLIDPTVACPIADLTPTRLTGELLPDWPCDDWLLLERERLRQLCLHGLDAICERLMTLGRYGDAAEAALAAVRGEPLRESAHRLLIAVHLAEGNQSEALRQYRWYKRLLRDELGIEPSEQIIGQVSSLRRAV